MHRNTNYLLTERGFSLIELLVVMIILGLLGALVGPKMFKKLAGSRRQAAKTQIELFGTALDAFRLDVMRYPTSEEGLEALRSNPGDIENWGGPYIKKAIPKDPWKHDYEYICPGNNGEYDIISYGLDGSPGGEGEDADVVSWE